MKTNELIWTKEKPTKAGWYWYREDSIFLPSMQEIERGRDGLEVRSFVVDEVSLLKCYTRGEWAGPIPEPREAEAAPVYEDPNPTMLHPKPMVCILKPDEFRERGEMYGQQGERGLYVQIVGTSKLKDGTPVYEVQI